MKAKREKYLKVEAAQILFRLKLKFIYCTALCTAHIVIFFCISYIFNVFLICCFYTFIIPLNDHLFYFSILCGHFLHLLWTAKEKFSCTGKHVGKYFVICRYFVHMTIKVWNFNVRNTDGGEFIFNQWSAFIFTEACIPTKPSCWPLSNHTWPDSLLPPYTKYHEAKIE